MDWNGSIVVNLHVMNLRSSPPLSIDDDLQRERNAESGACGALGFIACVFLLVLVGLFVLMLAFWIRGMN